MIKKCLCFTLICLLSLIASSPIVFAQTKTDNAASSTAKIKAFVIKRGTGENKRVQVQMSDGTKLKGYITQSDDDSFTLVESKTKQSTTIAYGDVAKVKNRLSKGDKFALAIIGGAGAAAAIVLGSFIFIRCKNEGGC